MKTFFIYKELSPHWKLFMFCSLCPQYLFRALFTWFTASEHGCGQSVALMMCTGGHDCLGSILQVRIFGFGVSHLPLDNTYNISYHLSLKGRTGACGYLQRSMSKRQGTPWTGGQSITAQVITDCENFTQNFKLLGVCIPPLLFQTLNSKRNAEVIVWGTIWETA